MADSLGLDDTRPPDDEFWIELVTSRAKHSQQHFQGYNNKLARWYDLYRGIYSGRFQAFRNNVHLPFVYSVVQSDVARKVQTSFGSWPIVTFVGYAPEDAPIARKNEVLVSAQMKDCGSFQKGVDFFVTGDLYGFAVAQVGWKHVVRKEQWREINMELGAEVVMEGDVVRFDGPDWEVVDPLDFWMQPGVRRIEDMAWVIRRFYMELDEIKAKVKDGEFNERGLRQLTLEGMSGEVEGDFKERMGHYRNASEWEARKQEAHSKPIEIWQMWGHVPADKAPDGVTFRRITVANRRALLAEEPMPFWHGELPFITYCPSPDPHYPHGMGKAEIAEKMQLVANRFANQKLDALDLFIDPVMVVSEQTGIDQQNLFLRAGRIIKANTAVDDTMIRPLSPDLSGLQHAYTEIAQLWQWIQQGTGIVEDTVSGLPSSGRQTAREYLGRAESATTRLMLESRLAEEQFVERLGNMFRMLNKQYLKVPHTVKIMGSAALINPITGMPMPPDPVEVGLEDINPDYRARAIGSTQMIGRAQRQQNLMAVMQAMASVPPMAMGINWMAFARELLRTFDIQNPDELLNPIPTILNQQALGAGGLPAGPGGQPMGPGVGPGAEGGPPEMVPPMGPGLGAGANLPPLP